MSQHYDAKIGTFIDYDLWLQGIELLKFQIQQKPRSKHYNTLSMYYYSSVAGYEKILSDRVFFENRVSNGFFYGLDDEFAFYLYLLPKPGLGLRNYKFFSYPMRTLYYSVGLYLVGLTQDFTDQCRVDYPHIHSFYGGQLRMDGNKAVINGKSTYYMTHYKEFRRTVGKELEGFIAHKVILKLDIKDFFDDLSIPILLNLIKSNIKPSIQASFNFNDATIDSLIHFFNHLMNRSTGIPQAEHDLIGGFIGWLYLCFGDTAIDSEVTRINNVTRYHSIIRYVDDVYITLEFIPTISKKEREDFVDSLSSRIADILYYKLGLKLNTKSRLYWLNSEADIRALRQNIKKVSGTYQLPNETDTSPQARVDRIFHELKKLKKSRIGTFFIHESSIEHDILKEVYDKSVDQLLSKPSNIKRLEKIMRNFNYDFVKVAPAEITAILMRSKSIESTYRQFLLNKKYLPTDDVDLILKFLTQVDFGDRELITKLTSNKYMEKIVAKVFHTMIDIKQPGYYSIEFDKLSPLLNQPHIIEQIRLRSLNERLGYHSVALNHLLNEIHAICHLLDQGNSSPIKDYDANKVHSYLLKRSVSHDICNAITRLFDRRNINQVSHSGSNVHSAWAVTQQEYIEYRDYVGQCLGMIL